MSVSYEHAPLEDRRVFYTHVPYEPPRPPRGVCGDEVLVKRELGESLGIGLSEECLIMQITENGPADRARLNRLLCRRLICINDKVIATSTDLGSAMETIGANTPVIRLTVAPIGTDDPDTHVKGFYWGTGLFKGYRRVSALQHGAAGAGGGGGGGASASRRTTERERERRSPANPSRDSRAWCKS